jgi:EpsI family protein
MFRRSHVIVGAAMLLASGLSIALTPARLGVDTKVDFEKLVPSEFEGWKEVKTPFVQADLAPRDRVETTTDQPYDETLLRTYANADGRVVMLALAWGRTQRQEVKIHRPELCYVAQGFEVKDKRATSVPLAPGLNIPAYRLLAGNEGRNEPITYWIRIGNTIPATAWQSRMTILKEGLAGHVPDGILVRVSQALPTSANLDASYATQAEFLKALYAHLDETGRRLMVGLGKAS